MQESRAVAEKLHGAVVKFDTYQNQNQNVQQHRAGPCDSTALVKQAYTKATMKLTALGPSKCKSLVPTVCSCVMDGGTYTVPTFNEVTIFFTIQ